jgi:hypothetical protein
VPKKTKVDLPITPLPDLLAWWQSQKVQGLVIGGVAASLLGRPRITRDLDAMVMILEADWPKFVAAAAKFGFSPRVPDVLEFARESRMLLFRHSLTSIDIDIAIGELPFEADAVKRAVPTDVGGVSVPLPTPEDLVIMKAVANREQDWLDIDGLLTAHPTMDLKHVRQWVKSFADALESPEIGDELEKRIGLQSKGSRRRKSR